MAQNEFRNALQAMSNSAASTVSAPVDGIAWLLRKAGIPIPGNALGGSDWMAAQGLTAPVRPGASQIAGDTLGLLAPMVAAAKAPQIARGLLQMGENALAPRTIAGPSAGQRGMIDISALKAQFPELDVSLSQTRDIAMLNKVAVPQGARNEGRGTEFMQALVKAADEDGARLGLNPSSDFGGSKARLEEFYKRFGFKFNKGRSRDLELMASMVRQPIARE